MSRHPNIPESLLRKLYYDDGLTQAEIGKKLGWSQSEISRQMADCGIVTRTASDYIRLNLSRDELYQLYIEQGMTTETVGKHFGCDGASVVNYLKAYNIPVRKCGTPPVVHVPPSIYTHWTPELAYAVGLITSDGCLPRSNRGISLSSVETETMDWLRHCLQLPQEIQPRYRKSRGGNCKPQYELQLYDAGFRSFLESVGLTPAKSKTLKQLAIPDNVFFDFLRGAWDGDGCWTVNQNKYLRAQLTSASPIYLAWVQGTIERLSNLHGNIYSIKLTYYTQQAIRLGEYLYYAPHSPALSYKRTIWERFRSQAR